MMGLEWVVPYCRLCRMDHIVFSGSYRWIVLYRMELAGLDGIVYYRIVSDGSVNISFYALAGYCLDGTDGLDGALVGREWDEQTLATSGMGAPPWALEQERHRWLLRGGGLCEVVAGTNCVGAARTWSICVREAK